MAVDSLRAAVRQAKNAVMQFTDVEVKVRDATSNDPWGPTSTLMAEIARATNDYQEYPKLFHRLWSRLNDTEHVMHVQKSLILIDYLLRNGSERFINDCKRRARDIAQLKRFKHYDANNNDDAKEARAKASMVYDLLMNDKLLAEERQKARKIADVKSQGFGGAGGMESLSTDAYGRRYDDANNGHGGGGDEFGGFHDASNDAAKGRNSAGNVLDDADEWGRPDSRTQDKPIRKKSAPSKNNDDDEEEDKDEEAEKKKKKKKKKPVKEQEHQEHSPVSPPAPVSKPKKKAEKKQEEVVEEEEPVEEEEEAPKKEKKKKSKEKEKEVTAADAGVADKKKKKKKKAVVEEGDEEEEATASSTSGRSRKTVEFASPKSNTSAAGSVDDPFSPNSSAAAAAASNADPFAVLPAARHNNNTKGGSGDDFLNNLSKSQGGIFDAKSDNNGRNGGGGGGFGDLDILTGGASARSEPTLTDMFAATSISSKPNNFPSSTSSSSAASHTMFEVRDNEKKPGKNDLWSAASDLTNLDNITQTERLSNRNKKRQQDTDNVMSMAMMRSIQPLGSEKSAAPITMTPTMTTGTPAAMPPPMNMNMGMYSAAAAYPHPNAYALPPNYPNAYAANMQPYPMGVYPPGGAAMPNRSPHTNNPTAFFDVPRGQPSSTANNNTAFNALAWGGR